GDRAEAVFVTRVKATFARAAWSGLISPPAARSRLVRPDTTPPTTTTTRSGIDPASGEQITRQDRRDGTY
ncbi:MAG: hypothetical protein V4755_04265, partial [Curtobacterium sp.]